MTLADQIVVLKDGIVQQVGTPVEIYERPANRFVAGFFGTPTMNFLAADLAQAGDRQAARGPGFEIPLDARRSCGLRRRRRRIVVGIRPERLSLERRGDDVALSGEVAMREVLGAEVVLHVESRGRPADRAHRCRLARRAPATPSQVWLDPHVDPPVRRRDGAAAVKLALVAARSLLGCALQPSAHGIVLWHAYTGVETTALEATARALERRRTPTSRSTLVAVPYGAFADKLTSAIPRRQRPRPVHLSAGSDRRLGRRRRDRADRVLGRRRARRSLHADAMGAMAYHGSLWGLPLDGQVARAVLPHRSRRRAAAHDRRAVALAPDDARAGRLRARVRERRPLRPRAVAARLRRRACMDDDGKLRDRDARGRAAAMAFARDLVGRAGRPSDAQAPARRDAVQRGQGRDRDVGSVVRRRHRGPACRGRSRRCR